MKNGIVSITLAVMLALSVGLVGCGGEEVPEITEYNLTISSTEGGSVTAPGEGAGSFTYDDGTVVSLVAEADEGYHFVNWAGNIGTVADVNDATTTITVDNHYSITANFACGPAIPLKNPGSFVQMTTDNVSSLDPAWVNDGPSGMQVSLIYDTLLYYDGQETAEFRPVLATEWNFNSTDLTLTFKIREGVKFHNGGDLTPEDVEYSFERVMVLDTPGGPAWMFFQPLMCGDVYGLDGTTFAAIDEAVEVDGDSVVFTLCGAYWELPFLQILCGPWASIVDKSWCIAEGDWDGTEAHIDKVKHPQDAGDTVLFDQTNGTGPWKLEEWDPGVQIKLVRNDDYWQGPAAFEMVTTQVVEEWTTRKEALLAGDADFIYASTRWYSRIYGQLEGIGELEDIEDLNVYQDLPEFGVDAFFFNMAIDPDSTYIGSGALDGNGIPTDFFCDIDVRKGFNYAFDWEIYINDVFLGEAEQRGSPIVEGLPFYNPDASMYSLDLDKGEEHLRLAWDGEVWEKGFKFTVVYNPGNLARETACQVLAENLAAINPKFQVSILSVDWDTRYVPDLVTGLLPVFQVGPALPDYPHANDFIVPFMASYGVFAQLQSYGYPELDLLIEEAFKELNPELQQDMYYELQERYYEDAPSIMLCQPLGRRYFTKYIEGFYFNPMIPGQAGPLYYMSKSSS